MTRWTVAAATSLLALLVVVLAVSQLTPTRLTLVDQALAAIGTGSTIHVVIEVPNVAEILDPKSGAARPVSNREEFWSDAKLGTIFERTVGGVLTNRVVFPRSSWGAAAREWRSFVSGYRKALREGSYHVVSKGQIDGKQVEWITSKSVLSRGAVEEVAISTATFKPLYVRYLTNGAPHPGARRRAWSSPRAGRAIPRSSPTRNRPACSAVVRPPPQAATQESRRRCPLRERR